jgi:hypothetical protein
MLKAIWRPLTKWPGVPTPHTARIESPFFAKYAATLNLLEYELGKLGAQNITIQAQLTLEQIGNDRWPKPGITFKGPAVIVSFRSSVDEAEYSYPCDTFLGWQSNLRAIALALEALRKIDRYGVAKRGEQYQGFRALPPGSPAGRQMSPEEAAEFIATKVPGVDSHVLATDQQMFEMVLKLAQKRVHPDTGGSNESFARLQEAAAVLIEHFKAQAKAGGAS